VFTLWLPAGFSFHNSAIIIDEQLIVYLGFHSFGVNGLWTYTWCGWNLRLMNHHRLFHWTCSVFRARNKSTNARSQLDPAVSPDFMSQRPQQTLVHNGLEFNSTIRKLG
jgi:hypothetical protein